MATVLLTLYLGDKDIDLVGRMLDQRLPLATTHGMPVLPTPNHVLLEPMQTLRQNHSAQPAPVRRIRDHRTG